MANIKTKKISNLSTKTTLSPSARLPIIDTDDNGLVDNYAMQVSLLTQLAKGDKGDVGPVGPASTVPGPVGPPGPANSLSIGTVASGTVASASITGTAPTQKLSLVLPKGDKGDIGPVGPPGPAGTGAGDMLASIYDPSAKAKQVAFKDETDAVDALKADKSNTYTKSEVDSIVASATPADATTTTKGVIKLAGDLGGTADSPTVPGLAAKEPTIASGTTSQYYRGDKTWRTLNKAAVGLGNVDNTSDANKPVSTATQTAIDAVIANGVDGFHAAVTPTANKIPVLDGNAKMPLTTIPGYAFKARRTTNLSSSSTGSIDIIFDGKLYDFGNWYSTSTGLATAPVDGVYHFEASGFVETVLTSRAFFTSRGSAIVPSERGVDMDSANVRRAKGTWEIYMTAGQTFGVSLYTNSSNQLNNVDTWLTGHLVIAG